MPSELAAQKTTVDASDVAGELAATWPHVVGGAPSLTAIRMLVAMVAFESGDFKGVWRNNVGNLAHSSGDGYDWQTLHTSAGPKTFRAYPTLDLGVADFLTLLSHRYPAALVAADANDVDAFAHALKVGGYYGDGSESDYRAGVARYLKKYASLAPAPAPGPSSFSPVAALVVGVPIGLALVSAFRR